MSYRNNFVVWIVRFVLACLLNDVHADSYFVDCGSPMNTTLGDRVFMGDIYSTKYLVTPVSILANTSASTNLQLYQSARIFNSVTSYKFPIENKGRYILRLHFFPFNYNNYNLSTAKFTIFSQQFVLLQNFTPTSETMKEYSFNVYINFFEIIIEPIVNFFAFLYAIEVFLVPSELVQDDAILINPREDFKGLTIAALESVFQINIGGPNVSSINDSLWRTWSSDVNFVEHNIFSTKAHNSTVIKYRSGQAARDVAPTTIYETCRRLNTQNYPYGNINVTWNFNVDILFQYLVRFHYCDIVSESANTLFFNVYVDQWIVSRMLDLTTLGNGSLHTPIFSDFVTSRITSNKLKVSIAPPRSHVNNPNAILNGLEIMKISDSENNLDKGDNLPSSKNGSKGHVGMKLLVIVVVVVVIVGFLALVVLLYRDQDSSDNATTTNVITSDVGHRIPLGTIINACNNFDENLVIGMGSFGKVYKGIFEDGTRVAIKRGQARFEHRVDAFRTELELLSQFRHRHLVSLIGYCEENNEIILIYEYMENGSLKSHLYGSRCSYLSWKQRLQICIGAARGLQYLHTGSTTLIVHRDVKSANILLDENFINTKVADFKLAKIRFDLEQDYITTFVKGSFGYLDPEYVKTMRINIKSDVYSFGDVLIEVLCARAAADETLPEEMTNLVMWALECNKNGQLESIIDPCLQGNIKPESLRIYWEIAEKCVADKSVERPSINDVLCNLEHALHVQEEALNPSNDPQEGLVDIPGEASTSTYHATMIDHGDDDVPSGSWSKVFSDLVKSSHQ